MAVYRWRIPMLAAVQFDGKNHKVVKELIGDDSEEKEKFMLKTGKFEEAEPAETKAEAQPEGEEVPEGEPQPEPSGEGAEAPAEAPKEILEELTVAEGDWVTKDVASGKVEVNPEGFPEKYEFISG
jgi:hypothetical protein